MHDISAEKRAAAAEALGLHEQYVYQLLSGRRPVPTDRCAQFERAFNGELTCEQLRPDVHWHRVPDTNWPWHPAGRPLIDVAKSATSMATAQAANASEARDAA